MNPSSRAPLTLLMAAVAVFVVGVALAVAQPGDLGDDETASPAPAVTSAQTGSTDTSATTPGDTSATTLPGGATATTGTDGSSGGSGGGGGGLDGSGTDTPDTSTAATGAESMLPLGLVLVAAALAARRLRARTA